MRVIQINKKNGNLLNELNGKMNDKNLYFYNKANNKYTYL